jgi:transcription termination factor 2
MNSKVEGGALNINVFHGPKRSCESRELVKYDVVLTSYPHVASDFNKKGVLYQVNWERIVLDEGQIIEHFETQQSKAVFAIPGKYRWVLTGTPINKEFDLFGVVKFLRCKPFDDESCWDKFIEDEDEGETTQRRQCIINAIFLSRTKD